MNKHPYFNKWDVALGRNVAKALKKFTGQSASKLYSNVSGFLPGHVGLKVQYLADDLCLIAGKNAQVHFPFSANDALPIPVVHMMSVGITDWLKNKYQYPGFVEVERGDTVIDCGSFAGGFSLSAADRAKAIYAFEPSPRNFAALTKNAQGHDNITPVNMGLYNKTTTMKMNLSSTHVDDSLLAVDHGEGTGEVVDILLITLDEWAAEQGIEVIDFFKLEAEGVENEVLEGIQKTRVRKFAVDCSPEREGQSNINEMRDELEKRGYETKNYRYWLYAREKA